MRKRALGLALLFGTLLVSPARAQLSAADSSALDGKVRSQTFAYLMDWRYEWWDVQGALAFDKTRWAIPPDAPGTNTMVTIASVDTSGIADPANPLNATSTSGTDAAAITSILEAQQLKAVSHWVWPLTVIPLVDPRLEGDLIFPDDIRLDVRKQRTPVVAALDAAAKKLPGDRWIVAQRVRMHVDQGEPTQALVATRECKAAPWWCLALRGFVWYSMGDTPRAAAAFDSTLRLAPDSVSCAWNDVSALLPAGAAAEYAARSCADRAELNARIWWLSDPLYLTPGNERKVEHYGRRMLLDLHTMVDSVDGLFDYRDRPQFDVAARYQREGTKGRIDTLILRYGYPASNRGCSPVICKEQPTPLWRWYLAPPPAPPAQGQKQGPPKPKASITSGREAIDAITPLQFTPTMPPGVQKWRALDTKETYLGTYANIAWPGPQYHTLPSMSAIADPLHATDADWTLGPTFTSRDIWDVSWWPTEFYARDAGPLFNLPTQIAFFRRSKTALIAAAAEWDTAATFRKAPGSALFGIAMSSGPHDTMRVVAGTVSGAKPPPVLSPIASTPMLLGVEMIPSNGSDDGAASRTRFGIAPPAPLSALGTGDIALSDPVLVRVQPNDPEPATFADAITRMYGTTRLIKPQRVAVAWEVYGQADNDTVTVSLRIVRRSDSGLLSHALSAITLGRIGPDSLVVGVWSEPRAGDRPASIDGGTTIRLRSLVLELSGLGAGSYSLEVTTRRRTATATARREFTIER